MTYDQAVSFLIEELPLFQLQGSSAYRPGLERTLAFSSRLGDPHTSFSSVHVGGTNGKGSTSAMLSSVLRSSGFRVGLYTSPHLLDFRERIQVDGQMISCEAVTSFVEAHSDYIISSGLSFFEATTIMAFDYFRSSGVDIAVVEVGLGGALDSTNIITPLVSVITNVDLDHVNILGDTRSAIALQKGGIIKADVPVVVGESSVETDICFIQQAKSVGSNIIFADKCYRASQTSMGVFRLDSFLDGGTFEVRMPLVGSYQTKNLVCALTVLDYLSTLSGRITRESVLAGLSVASIRGRWEVLGVDPLVICDTGHNVAGIRYVSSALASMEYSQLYFVLAMVGDKDIRGVLSLLPSDGYYYFTQARIPRAMLASDLFALAQEFGLRGEVVTLSDGGVSGALSLARSVATSGDLIFVGGSNFTVSEVL